MPTVQSFNASMTIGGFIAHRALARGEHATTPTVPLAGSCH